MRIAVLWTRLSGYMNACLRVLAEIPGTDLFVSYQAPSDQSPFTEALFSWIPSRYRYESEPDKAVLLERLRQFHPDVLLVSSWHIPAYRFMLRRFSAGPVRVLCMDNPWLGTAKQWLGVFMARWYLHPLYDAVFLPGERQAVFARKLGFCGGRIWRGLYSCDHPSFATVYRQHRHDRGGARKAFIYVGRLSKEKGIDALVDGYQLYRKETEKPWPLIILGEGPLHPILEGIPGIVSKGFVQPNHLPEALIEAECLVLPSRFEPWGVVIHEAAAAGLAIICTAACGASVHLVQDGWNGFVVETANPRDFATALARFSRLNDEHRHTIRENSFTLSALYTPERWATIVFERAAQILAEKRKETDRTGQSHCKKHSSGASQGEGRLIAR